MCPQDVSAFRGLFLGLYVDYILYIYIFLGGIIFFFLCCPLRLVAAVNVRRAAQQGGVCSFVWLLRDTRHGEESRRRKQVSLRRVAPPRFSCVRLAGGGKRWANTKEIKMSIKTNMSLKLHSIYTDAKRINSAPLSPSPNNNNLICCYSFVPMTT